MEIKKSFKSFNQLFEDFPAISQFIENDHLYLAHTSKHPEQKPEKLIEHIEKVNKYARLLAQIHGLDAIVDSLINEMVMKQPNFTDKELIGNYIKSLFVRSIIFHDYGKINPNFQLKKMQNTVFSYDESIKIDSQHSKLSAFIFIHYHLRDIESLFEEEAQSFLWALAFLFANPILKHHASFIDHFIDFKDDVFESLNRFLIPFRAEFENSKDYFIGLEKQTDQEGLLDFFEKYYSASTYFPIFALLKLNFSLLTASDYYATFDYTSGNSTDNLILSEADFGLIDSELKQHFLGNFWEKEWINSEKENYNFRLRQNWEFYQNSQIEDFKEKSKVNLNHLRQKLTVDVLQSIRENYQKQLFYLEAPTGAGKTNLSLALAMEFLQLDSSINKIFYVFPFNTLITQTFTAITETLGLTNEHIVQLHSKSGFHEKKEIDEDGLYGNEKLNYIDNQFINYPITLFSHIKFFDILKGNGKDTNYILHRLTNAIIIIDELQSYNPQHWDKVIFFLANYARHFNLKIILMSATLPKIDELLDNEQKGSIIPLIRNKNAYFTNENFKGRVSFDFEMLEKDWKNLDRDTHLWKLKEAVYQKAEARAAENSDEVKIIIEFIKKKSASEFFRLVDNDKRFVGYTLFLISGEILEPRRRQIIQEIKSQKHRKVLLISTQVVEAGVDIDMDLGFKDKSLIDSDEQLAGRVNRNASKNNCKVYIFDLDRESDIYQKDYRYQKTRDEISLDEYKLILETKDFDKLYRKVNEKIIKKNANQYQVKTLSEYKSYLKNLQFGEVNKQFKLIEEANVSVFIPLPIPQTHFSKEDIKTLEDFGIKANDGNIDGKDVWNKYVELTEFIQGKNGDYIRNQVNSKKLNGVFSKFVFSVYEKQASDLREFCGDPSIRERYGMILLTNWNQIYSYNGGFDIEEIESGNFL
jgi:CRISPR-associated endonuclease/helicase Cas3